MSDKKTIAVIGATGAQGGGLVRAEDIGRCAYGIFRRGPEAVGQRFGIAGEVLTGPEYAAFSRHLGVPVSFTSLLIGSDRIEDDPRERHRCASRGSERRLTRGELIRRSKQANIRRAYIESLPWMSFAAQLRGTSSRSVVGLC